MAARLVWLDNAKDDVRRILEYFETDSSMAAARYVAALKESCDRLADFPLSGRRYNTHFRSIVFRNHLIFFRFDQPNNEVLIAAVIDGRRDIAELMGERD